MMANIFATKNVEKRNELKKLHTVDPLETTDKSNGFFTKMVDDLIDFAEHDPELADGIKWLDEKAREKGISFYDIVFEVLYKHEIDAKAKEWKNSRN